MALNPKLYYKTVFVVEVLSEDPIPDHLDFDETMAEAMEGAYSRKVTRKKEIPMDGAAMAKELEAQGSEPAFFMLAADGSPANEAPHG